MTIGTGPVTTAVIGGSGLYRLFEEDIAETVTLVTPYGDPSGPIRIGEIAGRRVAFLARHGEAHVLPPHRVNYRANLWALAMLGVRALVTSAAVGGLTDPTWPGRFVLPDQLIDRTVGRADTFYDGADVQHLPAADPFCPTLHGIALAALTDLGEDVLPRATSVIIQGPRFSTRAESAWYRAAGADIVNMTQYPEAALAAELNIGLVSLSFVTDRDAGVTPDDTTDAVHSQLVLDRMAAAAPRILAGVRAIVAQIPDDYSPRELLPPDSVHRVLFRPSVGGTGGGTTPAGGTGH